MLKATAVTGVFLALSATGLYTVIYHAYASGGLDLVRTVCPRPPSYASNAQRHYTGLAFLDTVVLCQLVALFDAGFAPQNFALTAQLTLGFAPGALAYLVEFSRDGAPAAGRVGGALLTGIAMQLGSAAFAAPLAWIAIYLRSVSSGSTTGVTSRTALPLPTPMRRVQAEAAVGAVMLGYILPAALAVIVREARVIAYWQLFPVYMWIIQNGWLLLRDRRPHAAGSFETNGSASGLPVLRSGFALLGVLCAAQHLVELSQSERLSQPLAAFREWWPSLGVPDKSTVALHTAVEHLLKWDSIVFYTSMFAASVFLPVGQPVGEALALVVLAPIFSPGAAIALCWLRREERLAKAQQLSSKAALGEKKKKR